MPHNLLEKYLNRVCLAPDGGGDGGGDDSGDNGGKNEPEIDENHPVVQRIVEGLKNKNSQIIGKNKELQNLIKQYEGIDPDEAREALEVHRKSKDKKLLDEGKIEELLENRTNRMKADYESQLKAKDKMIEELTGKTGLLTTQLNDKVIGSDLALASTAAGVRPQAVPLVRKMADGVWKVEDGQPRAYEGNTPIMGKDTKPITMKEWVEGLRQEHGYLFKDSYGGDAGNKDSGKAGGSSTKRRSEMTVAEKTEYINAHGREAYMKLPG